MTPEKVARLEVLQQMLRHLGGREHMLRGERDELEALERELALMPEKADDPETLFTDESSRPQFDGSNYNDTLHRMTCEQVEAILLRVGRLAFDAAVAAVLAKR